MNTPIIIPCPDSGGPGDVRPKGMQALAPIAWPGALEPIEPPHVRLLKAFLSGRSPRTLRAYGQDLRDFALWSRASSPEEAARLLLACEHGRANEVALEYRNSLLERKLSPATVNRRLAALRSLTKLARTLGMVPWSLDVEGVRSESYRDVAGPGRDGIRQLLDIITHLGRKAGVRCRPHMVRHSAITHCLDLNGGDIRAAQRFSRHKDVRVLMRYDDSRKDMAGELARRLSEDL